MDATEETVRQLDRKRNDTNVFKGQIPCTPSRSVICSSYFELLEVLFSYGFSNFSVALFSMVAASTANFPHIQTSAPNMVFKE